MVAHYWKVLSLICLGGILPPVTASSFLAVSPHSEDRNFNELIIGNISRGDLQIYVFNYPEKANITQAFRIHIGSSNAIPDFPLMVVVRQQRSILSWQVPLNLDYNYFYKDVSRTLCPVEDEQKTHDDVNQTIYVEISTDSKSVVNYHLNATTPDKFELSLNEMISFNLSPSQPTFYKFAFPHDTNSVRVIAESNDTSCMIMSVQSTHCPVFDLGRNVAFKGTHSTVTTQGVITVQKKSISTPAFYVVFVLAPNDYPCSHQALTVSKSNNSENEVEPIENRLKTIQFSVQKSPDYSEYYLPVFGAIFFFLGFYLAAAVISLIYHYCGRRQFQSMDDSIPSTAGPTVERNYEPLLADTPVEAEQGSSYGSYGVTDSATRPMTNYAGQSSGSVARQVSEDEDFDKLEDSTTDKDILRMNKILFVSDLARKSHKHLTKKYRMYHWYLIIIAIFYGLPVIQLVITYQKVFQATGNEDLCYYNFYCANPFGLLASFNNIISNIGYVMLGLLFLGLTARRDYMHRKAVEMSETFQQARYIRLVNHGIPQYFGLFYAVGIALVMEGVLSACYHVCPNSSNFQFDTAFMYVLACLLMLKIYQTRHPDVNASAHAAYMMIAIIILIGVLGVFYGSLAFWIIFALVLILGSFLLTLEIYYLGRWALNRGMPRRIVNLVRNDGIRCIQPTYKDRIILLFFINCVNFGLALYGAVTQPVDFSSYLLAILMANLLMYFAFYIIMKLRSKEKILILPLIYILIACVTWAFALYFFTQHSTSWERTPAASRQLNSKCILLNFYDVHDVWHFLSAMSLFFSFMVLLTLDDDLVSTPRNSIPVF